MTKSSEEIQDKMKTLIEPVMRAVEGCKDVEEILMLASVMMTTSVEILQTAIGKENAEAILRDMIKK